MGAVLLAGIGVICTELVRIRSDLNAGRDALAALDPATVDASGGIASVVDDAADRIDRADERAHHSPVLGLLARLPLLGGQVEAVRDLTGAAAAIGVEGRSTADELQRALDDPAPGSSARLALARTAAVELGELSAFMDDFDIGADGWLLPPLAWAREDLATKVIEARRDLGSASIAADALAQFLEGPRRYLIVAGNNAEMRSAGVITSSGVANVAAGVLDVGDFLPNDDAVASPTPVPAPQEWLDLYDWLSGNYRYPGTLYTPNFPVAAELISEISARNVHGPVDGVIYVDTVTLSAVLSVIGPVVVEGISYDSTNVVEQLLYRNYLEFQDIEDNPERKELQSAIAQAAFDAIDSRDYSLFALADALIGMARSRHLMAWAAEPGENELWETLGLDAHLEADDMLVEVSNHGSSKLDYFVDVAVDLETRLDEEADLRRGTLSVTITNTARPATSPYIEGFSGDPETPGGHVAWVVFYLPQYATYITAQGFGFDHAGPDGPLYAAGTIVHIPEGESVTLTIEFQIPADQYSLTIFPAARVRPTEWTIDGHGPIPDIFPIDYDIETGVFEPDDRQGP